MLSWLSSWCRWLVFTYGASTLVKFIHYLNISKLMWPQIWWSDSIASRHQFSRSVVSNSVTPWIAARQASLSITNSWVYSNSYPLSRWCHPAISSSVVSFSFCSQSLPASGSFPMSQLFAWGDQSIGVSASASVLPMNTQDWFPSGWTGWISLQSKGLSRVFSNITVQNTNFSVLNLLYSPILTSIHDLWKNHRLD